ncbi:hypothetical protein [Rhizobium indigoferae]|uniref:hypothetical protein n=1 Tax=Rhizobium indigoferae TaxID=158891 RepID=UPI001FEA5FAE|nr:hypothetical protein [Rhizobium indigoferae]
MIYIALRNPEIGCGIEIIACFFTCTAHEARRISESRSGGIRDSEVGFFLPADAPAFVGGNLAVGLGPFPAPFRRASLPLVGG